MTMTPEARAERRALVLRLKRGGETFAAIGARLGVSFSRAQQLYFHALRDEQAGVLIPLPAGLARPLARQGLHTTAQIIAAWNADSISMGDGIGEGKMQALTRWALKQPGATRSVPPPPDLRLTRAQLAKAARLYALALVAHVGGAEDDEEQAAVKEAARAAAIAALDRLGFKAEQLLTLEDCINAVVSPGEA